MMNYYTNKIAECSAKVKSSTDERFYVRELAGMMLEVAREPRMQGILQRWRDVNSGRQPDRPPVWSRAAGVWRELLPQASLVCKDEFLRKMEYCFRQSLMRRDIDDDHPFYDYHKISAVFDETPKPPYGFEYKRHAIDQAGSAWGYESALQTAADFDRLTVPQYKYSAEKTAAAVALHEELLDGILDVKVTPLNGYFSVATICNQAAALRGMEQMMMDMILEPQLMHHLMQVITAGVMNMLDAIEESGLITPNIDEPMFLSDPLRPAPADGKYTLKDCWVAGNSQEFDQVDPAMTQEFLIDYQNKIFGRFGAVSYGCCENLTQKIDEVLTVPNLKVFVSSAWTDLEKVADKVGKTHCIMWRHSASDVTCLETLDKVREDTERGVKTLQGCRYQVVLREIESLFGRPTRIYDWAQMAKEIVSR
jgi:hypothetical protein